MFLDDDTLYPPAESTNWDAALKPICLKDELRALVKKYGLKQNKRRY
jgi:hypothetical protein